MSLTFADASARVDAYISQFKEGYFPPLLMLARLTEETGEIARVIAHQNGKTPKPGEDPGDLELELADLLFVMVCMANERGLSLERGFDRMMHKVETRDAQRWTRKDAGAEATPGPDAGEVELDVARETP
ncbi:nucleotide pyrophosphohydrolase [Deinococcus sp.]|uniref:nucleotide pyrophosphohydrolase n=1 Tax=Deinococcus sp. TaxID=47478 RepID=UPI002869B37C|nr:nucleotide pyrophosphohydrolase [Deinococcus sp.]